MKYFVLGASFAFLSVASFHPSAHADTRASVLYDLGTLHHAYRDSSKEHTHMFGGTQFKDSYMHSSCSPFYPHWYHGECHQNQW